MPLSRGELCVSCQRRGYLAKKASRSTIDIWESGGMSLNGLSKLLMVNWWELPWWMWIMLWYFSASCFPSLETPENKAPALSVDHRGRGNLIRGSFHILIHKSAMVHWRGEALPLGWCLSPLWHHEGLQTWMAPSDTLWLTDREKKGFPRVV